MGDRVKPDFALELSAAVETLVDLFRSISPDIELGEIVIKEKGNRDSSYLLSREIAMSSSFMHTHKDVRPLQMKGIEVSGIPIRFSRSPGKFNLYEEVARRTGMNREYVKQLLYMSGRLPDEEQRSLDRVLAACRDMRREIPG